MNETRPDLLTTTNRQIAWRLVPLLVLIYVLGQLDRVNVSFAALTMNRDLGFSDAVYGFGASLFFLGYLLFQLPANMLLERFGARRLIATIMLVWGVVSASTALVTNASQFYGVRLLLGVAESGLYPGIMLYITYWFARKNRAMAVALFMLSVPIAGVIGSPLSGWIMQRFDGSADLAGWQWLFLLEGLPCSLLALVVLFLLTDRPEQARWLSTEQKQALGNQLAAESVDQVVRPSTKQKIRTAFSSASVWWLCMINFFYTGALVGALYWLPKAVARAGEHLGETAIGWHVGLPYLAFALSSLVWSWHSDQKNERFWHPFLGMLITAIALFWLASNLSLLQTDLAISLFMFGIGAGFATFWGLTTTLLSPAIAAIGIALINIAGSLGSFAGIALSGQLITATAEPGAGFLLLGTLTVAAVILMLIGRSALVESDSDRPKPKPQPDRAVPTSAGDTS
ncbi:MAG: MFS transporter [Immundisolibacteraceae bacterium]|nr:MFS transporter [Immundisolibacteraceae bacterium]